MCVRERGERQRVEAKKKEGGKGGKRPTDLI